MYRLDVEVVRRLVEQQHIRLAQQDLRQFDTHTPSSGELARGSVEIGAFKAQSRERALNVSLIVVSAHELVTFMFLRETFHELHVRVALIVGAGCHLLFHLLQLRLHLRAAGKSLAGLFKDGRVVGEFHDLGQIAYLTVIGDPDGTGCRFLQPADYLEHRRFAGAVLAHEGDTVMVVDDITDIMKQRSSAKFDGEVVY